MSEKFSIAKFFKSFFEILPWIKTTRHLIGIAIILVICLGVYQKFFKKNNVQQTTIKGNVDKLTIIQKPSRFFIPFAEGTVGQDSNGGGFDASIRAGVRVEF
ncbi:hypothetical protein [Sulfuricurvum sp.]|uniref:hypothetical protein n=1 Tax=Sulfuricurvum sp. TaxID=2025608 RepID=UPI003562892A